MRGRRAQLGTLIEEYWRFHLEREHQRLYPGVSQR
jgi:hypothetical protein